MRQGLTQCQAHGVSKCSSNEWNFLCAWVPGLKVDGCIIQNLGALAKKMEVLCHPTSSSLSLQEQFHSILTSLLSFIP
jgi:hypothetical protein